MEQNVELRHAWDFVENTGKSIFLTGKAGTGKTTFLKTVVEKSAKRAVVVAPTGIAALNAGGVTIHSFFQLPLSPFVPDAKMKSRFDFSKEKRKIVASMDLLIIDEISMVRSDLLDAIDSVLRRFRNHFLPFGGVQLLMIGDLAQLTPVVTPEDETILKNYYDTPYFFGSKALAQTDYVTIQLEKVYRQEDEAFIELLNHIRNGEVSAHVLQQLNSRYQPHFVPRPEDGYIRLTTHNASADRQNEQELSKINHPVFTFNATIDGTFPEYSYPTFVALTLKLGAQVMFVKNDPTGAHRYYNGRIGRVTYVDQRHVHVLCQGDTESIEVEPQEWENTRYKLNEVTREIETELLGTFKQLPLRLAWAITIHKSQGLTFEHAIIDANMSFAPGQVYVALSRCRSLQGLVLASPIEQRAIINDNRVDNYIAHQESAAQQSIAQLPTLKEAYRRNLLLELFDFNDLINKQERVNRIMIEYFYHAFPQLTDKHKNVSVGLKRDITDVALKWRMTIGRMETQQLHDKDFLERVKRSAAYFEQKITNWLTLPIELTRNVKSNNKEAMRRLGDAYAELKQAYLSRRYLLSHIEQTGFTTTHYLKHKQHSLVYALDADESPTRNKKKAAKKEKPKKEDTKLVSLRLLRQGMRPEQIAKERALATSTILTHLSYFVAQKELSLADIIEDSKLTAIQAAIARLGMESSIKNIKDLCPPDVTYTEIGIVMQMMKES